MLYERHSPKKMKWVGFGGEWGTNRSQSDFFDKKGLKAPKSAFKTRYMIYNEQLLYQHGKQTFLDHCLVAQNAHFFAQNSPKYNFSLRMTNECYINPAKL